MKVIAREVTEALRGRRIHATSTRGYRIILRSIKRERG